MRQRFLIALAAGALMAAMLPGVVTAEGPESGRPGQFEVSMNIFAESSSHPWDSCYAQYKALPPYGEDNIGTDAEGYATVHVVENKQGVWATCKTIDISGIWESNAEVGYTDDEGGCHA